MSFNFTDPETAMNYYTATTGNMQLRMEGGYEYNSKPISLNKSKKPSANNAEKKNCSSHSSGCCSRNSNKAKQPSINKNKNSWVRIQPSIGMGFIPVVKTDVVAKTQAGQTTYQYNAGNWNTALIAGAGFEFGKGSTRQFTVSVNYFKGLGNLDESTISSAVTGKSVTTILESATSGWNVKVGIPFTLGGKSSGMKNWTQKKTEHRRSGCGQYRIIYRCVKSN